MGMPGIDGLSRPPRPVNQRVWVDLARLYGPAPTEPTDIPDGADLTGRVPGVLKWWVRANDGRWLGRVDFAVTNSHGGIVVNHEGVLVPADVLEPIPPDPPRR